MMKSNSEESDNLLTESPRKLELESELELEVREEKKRKVLDLLLNRIMGRREVKRSKKVDTGTLEGLSELSVLKSLCVFFKFKDGPLLYSLYAYVIAASDFINVPNPPPPSPAVTILEMPRHEKFPIGMACVELGSRIYFVGGQCQLEDGYYASKKVYYLDFNTFRNKLTSTTSSSSGSLINCDELSECPNMNGGKCNPVVMTANGKLYVLTGIISDDLNTRTLGSPPDFNVTDWTLIALYGSEWKSCAFEVFDPVTDEWTILPLPTSYSSPNHILPAYCSGHAVIHDKIFFFNWGDIISTFDLKTHEWKFFDAKTIAKTQAQARTCDDAFARSLVDNPLTGCGLVLNETLYGFSPSKKGVCTFCAYHIPDNLGDAFISRASLKLTDSYLLKRDSKSGLFALQAGFFYLGNDNFCSVFRETPETKYTEQDDEDPHEASEVYFVLFQIVKERTCSGDICWPINQSRPCKVQGINADLGSILDFFTL